ncbi:MAG: peptidoglycan-binding domain-containing protein [Bryobacterales bacterium]|nr:peptidoglycan-binding domain-containing protein [Bryobacterales bacterium]
MIKLALPIVLSAVLAGILAGSAPVPSSTSKKPAARPSSAAARKPATTAAKKAAATTAKKAASTTAKKAAARPSSAAAKKSAARTTKKLAARSSSSSKKGSNKKPVQSWRTSQQQPASARYLGIQQALIGRGYLEGPATGEWGPQSVEALKKFQLDQNLKGDGKLDSLSLIALGLGPKRSAIPQAKAQP